MAPEQYFQKKHGSSFRGTAYRGRSGGRGRGAQVDDQRARYAVGKDAHMSKTALRHYMDNTSAFWLDGASTEHDYFRTRDVMRPRTTTNCEALTRPGYFPSFYSANSDAGIDALLGLFGQRGQPDKACIGKLVEMLQSSGGQQFWAAVPYFNAKCDKDRTPEDSERHSENTLATKLTSSTN